MAEPSRPHFPSAAFLLLLSTALLLLLPPIAIAISPLSDIAPRGVGQRADSVGLSNCVVACAPARRRCGSGRSCARSAGKLGGDVRLVLRGGGVLDYSKSLP
ncbi:hypothetical protein T484DRAFT_1797965 [Baffinella frigidus]|nr:hypothetical protein T484DRAFT_1797965 [Cryptophyta sp. CCMP2293]